MVERHEPFEKLTKCSPPEDNPEDYLCKLNFDLDKVVRQAEAEVVPSSSLVKLQLKLS